jgi:hypothetical protein
MNRNLHTRLERLETAKADALPLIIAGTDLAECEAELARLTAEGRMTGRSPILVVTGVPGPEADMPATW